MNEEIKKFLSKIGVKAETIQKLNEPSEDFSAEEAASDFVKDQRSVAKNDPELIKTIRDEVRGTELSKIEHKIKKTFSLSAEEIKDKKFDEIIETAFEKSKATSNETGEELQNKILELNNKVKQYEEEIIPSERNKATEQINSFRRDLALRESLSKRQLIVGQEVAIPVIDSFLNQNYSVSVNEKGALEVKTKDGLNPLNSDGTKVLSFEEIIDNQLNTLQLIKQSNGGPGSVPPVTTGKNTPSGSTDQPKFNLPGMKQAEKNASELEKIKRFGE
jgi:hypothetical protein